MPLNVWASLSQVALMAEGHVIWPQAEQSRVGWHYLAILAELYPERMQGLSACGEAYGQAIQGDVPPGVIGWHEWPQIAAGWCEWPPVVTGPGHWTSYTPAVTRYMQAEHVWASHLGLLTQYGAVLEWVRESVRIVLAARLYHEPDSDLIGLCRQLAAEPHSWLGATMMMSCREDPMPAPLHAMPQFETQEDFALRARTYYQQQVAWLQRQGGVQKKQYRRLNQALRWVAWHMVEGLSWEAVAMRAGGEEWAERGGDDSTYRKPASSLVALLELSNATS